MLQHVIKSPKDGTVKSVLFQSGDSVSKNVALVHWEEETAASS